MRPIRQRPHRCPIPLPALLLRWLEGRVGEKFVGSQNALMITVCVARWVPFLSFDVVSYVAGLTAITTWRFVVAPFIGILPASFLLAHVGGEFGSLDGYKIAWSLALLGVIGLLIVFVLQYFRRSGSKTSTNR